MIRRIPQRLALGLAAVVPLVHPARAAGTTRLGLPTKAYWSPILATAAGRQRFFAKGGIGADPTVYRGRMKYFEALATGAADLILDPRFLVATG